MDKSPLATKRYEMIAKETGKTFEEIRCMRKIAIMSQVGFGCRDISVPILYFNINVSECSGALAIVDNGIDVYAFITEYGVYDVHNLNGMPIWVVEVGNMIYWLEPCLIEVKK
jgi:hypothetical protein